jgi:diguanylate cyclase (GGDEF)-like protein
VKVLVADDDSTGRRILGRHLEKWGYQVEVVADGEQALARLTAEDPPRLAILDWMMPGEDGVEVCRAVRAQCAEPYVYIILLTGRSSTEDLVEALDAGADDFITKPFQPLELEVRLRVGRRSVDLHFELIEAREALREQATRDSLTGIWNRRAVLEVLERELARAQRHLDLGRLGVMLADLDHFKQINDTYGHPVGDEVLREVAARMRRFTRPYDTVGRYGGEEFLVVLADCGDEGVSSVADRLRRCIADTPIATAAGELEVTMSAGVVAAYGDMEASADSLIVLADQALYRAKQRGRNRVETASRDALRVEKP